MDWRTEWPWSLEEEARWKAELEKREQDTEEFMDGIVEDDGSSCDAIGIPDEEPAEESIPEKYVTA
ncbi:MAG TPA: hypothetical protein VEI52_11185 [Terriglobales bacterium]|nr:hypothetical protein [Terriglobales bacterium]